MKNYFDFTGKKYLVTGASSGIGRATAIRLSKQGAKVVIMGRNEERLNETYSMMDGEGHIQILADLYRVDDMTNIFQTAMSDGIKLDGIVHSAGTAKIIPMTALNKRQFDDMMHINIYILLDMLRLFSKRKYHNQGGNVVSVSSMAAVVPEKCQTIYAAAKAGMNAAVQAVAQELCSKGIRVNTVMPGMTRTAIYYNALDELGDDGLKRITDRQILGVPEPEKIAEAIMFLLSDASGTITGRAMHTDSGIF